MNITRKMPRTGLGLTSSEKETFIENVLAGQPQPPLYFADPTDASIRALGIEAGNNGGGIVLIPAGTISILSSIPFISGVMYKGVGQTYKAGSTNWTKLVATGSFPIFSWNNVDNASPQTGPAQLASMLPDTGVSDLILDGANLSPYGIKAGALYNGGIIGMRFDNIGATNFTKWGFWLENCQKGYVSNLNASNCAEGYGMFVDSGGGNFNSGNYCVYNLMGEIKTAGQWQSNGYWFSTRGTGGPSLNDVHVFGCASAGATVTYTTTSETITISNPLIPFDDLSKVVVNQGVQFQTTVGNIAAGLTYFVLSKDAPTGSGHITVSDKVGGTVITPSAAGASVIKTAGGTNMLVGGIGGGVVTYSTFQGIDLEQGGTSTLVFQDSVGVTINSGLVATATGFNTVTTRAIGHSNELYASEGYVMLDADLAGQKMRLNGQRPAATRSGIVGIGLTSSRDSDRGVITLSGFYNFTGRYGDLSYDVNNDSLHLWKSLTLFGTSTAATSGLGSNVGNTATIRTSGGSQILPTLTSVNVGIFMLVSNATSGNSTITTTGGQIFNNVTGLTSFVLAPKNSVLIVGHFDNSTYYWQVYGLPLLSSTGVISTAGSGTPEGVVTAAVGSTYSRTDGGAGTSFYVKESNGTGNTGWVGK